MKKLKLNKDKSKEDNKTARKDWQKAKYSKPSRVIWTTERDGFNYSIMVKKVYFFKKVVWVFRTKRGPPNVPHIEVYYETKKEAMERAKRFMRKH